ncbi:MAG: Mut7-C RNAse domain-containing protein [Candidatus Omnitrophota bacterium]|nr:Mut7-C RNAse domain-containing protein [Candidatus Omnitrophota bacterium]
MKFILTKELGRLVKWLRILGFDTVYYNQDNPSSLIIQALRDERMILTRNQRLPQGRGLKIVLIKNEKIKNQVEEILKTLKIRLDSEAMFSRCILCNEGLVEIAKDKLKDKVPEYVFKTQEVFLTCPECKRIYWQGTHWGNVQKTLEEIKWNS